MRVLLCYIYSLSSSKPQFYCNHKKERKGKETSFNFNHITMISILAQERLLGATLGASLTGFIVFEQRRRIFNSISDSDSQFNNKLLVKESIFGKKSRSELAGAWNKAVDETFGPVIEAVSSRGW